MALLIELILAAPKAEYFSLAGWTLQTDPRRVICPTGNFSAACLAKSSFHHREVRANVTLMSFVCTIIGMLSSRGQIFARLRPFHSRSDLAT